MKLVNLGCGARFIEDWINFDYVSKSPYVKQVNLSNGIPLSNESTDFIYSSHVLEHFSKKEGEKFLKECYRTLRKGGIIRIVVPDLEQVVKNYLNNLNKALVDNSNLNKAEYNWSVVELLDQSVREESGGEMLKIWEQDDIINENQIIQRVGDEFLRIRKNILNRKSSQHNTSVKPTLKMMLKSFILEKLNVNEENLKVGNFRNGGEIHKWMYDRYSLTELLISIGFKDVTIVDAQTSKLQNWNQFNILDVENGRIRKPDSLFIEAIK